MRNFSPAFLVLVALFSGFFSDRIVQNVFANEETGASTAPPDAEADVGLEADVEGTGSGDDVAADPADGLSATPGL